jgi:glycosyltransferase involved in cell wall biosynthesis
MGVGDIKLVVISHAGIKQINRAVYRHLKESVGNLTVVIPSHLQLSGGQVIQAEPSLPDDPEMVPLKLNGRNPRTYFYPGLLSWLNVNRPQVLLLENDPASRLGLQLADWCAKNAVKIICQTYENLRRDLVTTIKRQGWKSVPKNQFIDLLNRRMASKVDGLLVVNRDSESIFQNYGYRNVFMLPLGYDKKVFFPSAEIKQHYRQKLSVPQETPIIGYFGRLVKQKGVHILLQALGQLKQLNWVLLLDHIHDSEDQYAKFIRTLVVDLQLEDRVIYFEADHFEIANYMRAADVMVAPSITTPFFKEQYGRAVQEAMACGCVCVVSDSGHLKDLVADKFLIFKEGDVHMLKGKLQTLLGHKSRLPDFRSYLENRAKTSLTTDRQAEKLLSLIETLIT